MRPNATPLPEWQPGQPLPKRADRKTLAKIITHEVYPVTERELRRWRLPIILICKRATVETKAGLDEARRRLAEAPAYIGGAASPDSKAA